MCSDNKPAKENPNIEWNVAETQINKLKLIHIMWWQVICSTPTHTYTP